MKYLGILEGFYGVSWPQQSRLSLLDSWRKFGFDSYLYAPKSDRSLRSNSRAPFSEEQLANLTRLRTTCQEKQISFGIGFSPALSNPASGSESSSGHITVQQLSTFDEKLRQVESLNLDYIAILFDDVSINEDYTKVQLALVDRVAEITNTHVIACPSYYSFDPVLEQVFGPMPKTYWDEWRQGLDPAIDVFWTGDKVISKAYPADSLDRACELFNRELVIWDNYPVNDGKKTSDFLYLTPDLERYENIAAYSRGLFSNAMNQSLLSQLPLAIVPSLLGRENAGKFSGVNNAFVEFDSHYFESVLGKQAKHLYLDRDSFEKVGLSNLSVLQKEKLRNNYKDIGALWSEEIVDWLDGKFVFDPACLTDS